MAQIKFNITEDNMVYCLLIICSPYQVTSVVPFARPDLSRVLVFVHILWFCAYTFVWNLGIVYYPALPCLGLIFLAMALITVNAVVLDRMMKMIFSCIRLPIVQVLFIAVN